MLPNLSSRIPKTLLTARMKHRAVPERLGDEIPKKEETGYALQAHLHNEFRKYGYGELAGWKVGATTLSMQTYLNVDGPAYGRVMSKNCYRSGISLLNKNFFNPGIECEIGVRINNTPHNKHHTRDSVTELLGTVFPAIEIVENRYGDFKKRGTPLLIADDFFHRAAIIGEEIAEWNDIDLARIEGETLIDGTKKGSGTGTEVMGHPLEAVAWLANTLRSHGFQLTEGQIILTGSVAPVIWLGNYPSSAQVNLSKLGTVKANFRS